MESIRTAAILTAIIIENRSLGFYHTVIDKVNSTTRRIFVQLAKAGAEHLELFCNLYTANKQELVTILNNNNLFTNPYYCLLLKLIDGDTTESDALQIALEEKQSCIDGYSIFMDVILEPFIYDMFVQLIDKNKKQFDMVKVEYLQSLKISGHFERENIVRSDRRSTHQKYTNEKYLFQARCSCSP
jgi:rubrerythrin